MNPLPEKAVESFAGIANPFALGPLEPGEKVIDIGSGARFDSVIAAGQVGPSCGVVGIDMTQDMLDNSRRNAAALGPERAWNRGSADRCSRMARGSPARTAAVSGAAGRGVG